MKCIHLWPEEPVESDDWITASVILEYASQQQDTRSELVRDRLWYRLPIQYRDWIAPNCDPFILGALFTSMGRKAVLHVHGSVSPSLLQNLEEFQAAWACWRPGTYASLPILAEQEQELISLETDRIAIAAFSGGVDSCFTSLRHVKGRCGRLQRPLQACLMVHGFDIPLDQRETFAQAFARSQRMVNSLGLELIPMATNFRALGQDWEDAHGAGLASCLMLLSQRCSTGLVPSTEPYQALIPWGSNPVTDHLLSSQAFQVVHDGAGFSRVEKVRQLADWPEALQGIRVCWQGAKRDRNCGQCEKCIRTILNFRVLGLGLPACFEQDATNEQIRRLEGLNPLQIGEFEQILKVAIANDLQESWVNALQDCITRNSRRIWLEQTKARVKQVLPYHWLKKA